jgi:hypothetical protein
VARYWIAPLLQWRMLNAMVGRMVVMVVMVVMVGPVEIVIAPTVITISMVTMAMVTATMTMSTTIVIAMAVSTNLHCRIVRRANSCHHSDRLWLCCQWQCLLRTGGVSGTLLCHGDGTQRKTA